LVKGKSIDEAEQIKNTQLAEELALPPVKIHCSVFTALFWQKMRLKRR